MFEKKFVVESANTLDPEEVCENHESQTGFYSRTHSDGWTISGEIIEDYYHMVNKFVAEHPVYGRVEGDFEDVVKATIEEGFNHFYKHHTPVEWDYEDI